MILPIYSNIPTAYYVYDSRATVMESPGSSASSDVGSNDSIDFGLLDNLMQQPTTMAILRSLSSRWARGAGYYHFSRRSLLRLRQSRQ